MYNIIHVLLNLVVLIVKLVIPVIVIIIVIKFIKDKNQMKKSINRIGSKIDELLKEKNN